MKVKDFAIDEIFDSRGNSTIEAGIAVGNGFAFYASVPAGKSRGSREAAVVSFAEASSAKNLKRLAALKGKDFSNQRSFDEFLIKLDGTENKRMIGGNVMLGLSMAFARAAAASQKKELWESLQKEFFGKAVQKVWKPVIFSNLINGGEHARNDLNIQEYMVLVETRGDMKSAIEKLISFYRDLGEKLGTMKRISNIPIGDEGGYSLDFKNNFEPLAVLSDLVRKDGLSRTFRLGVDAAANGFSSGDAYLFDGKKVTTPKLAGIYEGYCKKAPALFSIEDPFSERDTTGFALLSKKLEGRMIVSDDLTVTNRSLIEEYAGKGLMNGVIIKPNQAGTVTETIEAVQGAHERGIRTIVSHRSGETDDVFIIHLAKAAGAYGVKIGAPTRERIFKFNELLRIA
jgi:enolase